MITGNIIRSSVFLFFFSVSRISSLHWREWWNRTVVIRESCEIWLNFKFDRLHFWVVWSVDVFLFCFVLFCFFIELLIALWLWNEELQIVLRVLMWKVDLENFDERSQKKEAAHASMKKTGVRRSPPHYLMQLSLVDIVVLLLRAVSPRFSQMEWQILLAMGIMSVTLSKSVFLTLPSKSRPSLSL